MTAGAAIVPCCPFESAPLGAVTGPPPPPPPPPPAHSRTPPPPLDMVIAPRHPPIIDVASVSPASPNYGLRVRAAQSGGQRRVSSRQRTAAPQLKRDERPPHYSAASAMRVLQRHFRGRVLL
ncbi:vitelline membrane protein 15a-2-like [Schistocerca nitens]|uniref:vitelline membrane protein 15a-2-like n=1 Tax=Schistocerca nitens TaxID=7011 RepID=UPI0021182974|nr:vitelline membrane protein 15a-2-like [Schistocerca nitens]